MEKVQRRRFPEIDDCFEGDAVLVLIVEDDRSLCNTMARVLRTEGYRTLKAENGKIALHVVQEHEPDAILLDLEMPVMDGREFLREYRGIGCECPVVIVSGSDAEAARRELGAQAAVEKPFQLEDLLDVLDEVLSPR
jgi:CheY-like chemotaxis protein